MTTLICEHSFELKLSRTNLISNYQQFIQSLTKFKRLFLITYFYPNESKKRTILSFENPKSELKNHIVNNEKFLLTLKSSLLDCTYKKIKIEICKPKLI